MTAAWIDAFIEDRCEVGGSVSFTRFLIAARDYAGVLLPGREVLSALYDRGLVNSNSSINVALHKGRPCSVTLNDFSGKEPGLSSVREFFLKLCSECAVPPSPPYEAAVERELIVRNLITADGFVPIAIRGRAWPAKPPRKSSSRFRIGQLDLA